MMHDKENALRVLAKYLKRSDPSFLEEMYTTARTFMERVPRVDARTVATVLEFDPVKGVDPDALASKVIDNGLVEKLVKEGFIEKVFGKGR